MKALRLRARAKEVDAVVLEAVQALCASWWARWKLADGDDAPVVRIEAIGAGADRQHDPKSPAHEFAEIDESGIGYAVVLGDASALLRSVLGHMIQDSKFGELLADRLFQDLIDAFRRMTAVQASAKALDVRTLEGRQWKDLRTSARQFAIERDGSLLAWGRMNAAAVDALGPEPKGVGKPVDTLSLAESFGSVEAACQIYLRLEGLRWSDVSSCKKGDLLLGMHGLEAPAVLVVEGQVAPVSMQLHDLDGEWSVRIN